MSLRLAVCTSVFSPRLGGIEVLSAILAREFTSLGHDVTLLTFEPASGDNTVWEFQVLRSRGGEETRKVLRRADACLMMGTSLRWVNAGVSPRRTRLTISHQIPFERWSGVSTPRRLANSLRHVAKRIVCEMARNVYPSEYMRSQVDAAGTVIPNLFDASVFSNADITGPRARDVVFLGRLTPEKGPSLLLDALHILRSKGLEVLATFIGDGPEREKLESLADAMQFRGSVKFAGAMKHDAASRELATHRIMVVPSLWAEPFGIVALEGIASGCLVLGTKVGGLGEAIGEAGSVVEANSEALASGLERLLTDAAFGASLLEKRQAHLAKHDPCVVAKKYLNEMTRPT